MIEQDHGVIPDIDKEKIKAVLSKGGVKDVVANWLRMFSEHEGREVVSGITVDGLVLGIKHTYNQDPSEWTGYNAWVLDTSLPANEIQDSLIHTDFTWGSVDVYRDGGTTYFPGSGSNLPELANLSKEEILERYPEDPSMLDFVNFYKRTGTIYIPAPHIVKCGVDRPEVGDMIIYPLTQEVIS